MQDLPIKINRVEANFGLELRDYISKLKEPIFTTTTWLELKDSHGLDYIPFLAVEDIQIAEGLKTKRTGSLVRVTVGTTGTQDYIWRYKDPAYIVIRYPKSWCFIDIETFVMEKERSKRKSLLESRAVEISIKVINK
jgi:hypothetical protein